MEQISVKFENKDRAKYPFIIVSKPRGLPSAPIKEGDDCALTQALKLFPEIAGVKGKKEIECGLCHRIDTDTEGVLLIALTQEFYDYIQNVQADGFFKKEYSAICDFNPDSGSVEDGYPFKPFYASSDEKEYDVTVRSFFRPFGPNRAMVRPVTEESGKYSMKKAGNVSYETSMFISALEDGTFRASCTIAKGYRHQVRSHLAWCGFPIKGDRLYNPQYREGDEFTFVASGFSFPLPNGESFCYSL